MNPTTSFGAFPAHGSLDYSGVSSKCCKGLYKSILNAARCANWNAAAGTARYFMTGEDLTTQAGLAVQQDLALVNLIGLTHVERNGHHYVNGMSGLPEAEQPAFLAAHPDLYERSHGAVRLKIRQRPARCRLTCGTGLCGGGLSGLGRANAACTAAEIRSCRDLVPTLVKIAPAAPAREFCRRRCRA